MATVDFAGVLLSPDNNGPSVDVQTMNNVIILDGTSTYVVTAPCSAGVNFYLTGLLFHNPTGSIAAAEIDIGTLLTAPDSIAVNLPLAPTGVVAAGSYFGMVPMTAGHTNHGTLDNNPAAICGPLDALTIRVSTAAVSHSTRIYIDVIGYYALALPTD